MPLGSVEVAMVSVPPVDAALIFSVRLSVAVAPAASFTCAVNVDVPAAVGVPEIMPVAERFKPAGSVPLVMLQVYGLVPPLACNTET